MKINILLILFLVTSSLSNAQTAQNAELYKIILSKDSLLFNVGFNSCDIVQFEKLLSDDFEFFHDKDMNLTF